MVRIITDSTSDFTPEQAQQLGIDMLCLKVNFGSEEFIDKKTISNPEFYQKLQSGGTVPTTTLLSVGEFLEAFEAYPDDDIVVITIASKLSGTYQSARVAQEMSGRGNIYVVDSKTVTIGLAMLVLEAVKMARDGSSGGEIYDRIYQLSDKVRIMGMIDTLKFLVKGGRITGVEGAIGGLIGLKPLIFVEDGEVRNFAKARGAKAGMEKLEQKRNSLEIDYEKGLLFAHAENETLLREYMQCFGPYANDPVFSIGSVVGTHAGPGVIAFSFFLK